MNKIIGTILVASCSWMMGCAAEEAVGSAEDESALSTSIDTVDISVEKSLTKTLNAPARSLNERGLRENSRLMDQVGRPQ